MKHLEIAEGLRLPLDTVTETISILAKRGAGKTHTSAVLVEEMLRNGAQVVVLDPMGAWWGLRSSADGKGEGYSVAILGGDGTRKVDVALEHTAGALVAETIVETGISAVVDVSGFSRAKRKRFVQEFAEALYQKNREPLHLVLEEADLVAPQKPQRGEEPMLGAIEDLVRRGRGRGIGITLITQRSAVLNKDVLSQTEVLIALRTTSPHDRKAVEAWLDFHLDRDEMAQVTRDLPKLETGEAFVVSPALLKTIYRGKIRPRTTFDSSATPRAGERRIEPKKLADVDLDALRGKMAETIEAAEANDPKALRRRIATLEQEIERLGKLGPEVVIETNEVPVPVIDLELLGEIEERLGEMWPIVEKIAGVSEEVRGSVENAKFLLDRNALGEATAALRSALTSPVEPLRVSSAPAPEPAGGRVPRPTLTRKADGSAPGDPDSEPLKEGAWTILRTAAERFPMVLTRAQLATLSGYSARSSSYEGHLAALRRVGYLEKDGDVYRLTDEGAEAIGPIPGRSTSPDDLLEGWIRVLPDGAGRMLRTLVEAGEALDRGDLYERAGFSRTSSTPGEYLATLRRNGLVEVVGGVVYLGDEMALGKKGAA